MRFMLSPEELLRYRDLGPERRYALFLELAAQAWTALDADGPEASRRRWERIRAQHDEGSRLLLEGLARQA